MGLAFAACLVAFAQSAGAWWENGHEAITRGVVQNLQGTGDLQRFISETNDQFVKIPWIEPPSQHYIDIDTTTNAFGNAGQVSYATDFANFRAGTFNFPTTTAGATARYGSSYLNGNGAVPWTANDTMTTLTAKMQAAQTYSDWYRLLPTAGALGHYIQDMHNPMHLTKDYDGKPASGLHGKYEGGQFERGSVRRYPELIASITPVSPTYYGAGPGFINALFNRIPIDYDKNPAINSANVAANSAGTGVVYYDALWENTKSFTKESFQDAAWTTASALYTAYRNAGSPVIPAATFFATPAAENSTITRTGPVLDYSNQDFFSVRGGDSGRYGVVRFDMAQIQAQFDERYGEGGWMLDNVALAVESSESASGSLKVFFSQDDTTNIQAGSALRYLDNGAPLGINIASSTPLLQFAVSTLPLYTVTRFDSNTPQVFNWTALQSDILNGDEITLVFAGGTSSSFAYYFGGSGLSLEVSARAVPEPSAPAMLALAAAALMRRSSRNSSP
jgi:hypothetical protein